MTRDETKTILATMASVYPRTLMPEVTELTINVWFQLLQDVPYSSASVAVAAWLSTNKYPPTIADIREKLSPPDSRDAPEEAWGTLMSAVRKFGHTQEQDALNSLTGACRGIARRFGWRYWCQMPIEDESTYYAQFRNAYTVEVKREIERKQIPSFLWDKLKLIGGQHETSLLLASSSENEEEQPADIQQLEDREAIHNAVGRLQDVLKGLQLADTERSKDDAEGAVQRTDGVLHAGQAQS